MAFRFETESFPERARVVAGRIESFDIAKQADDGSGRIRRNGHANLPLTFPPPAVAPKRPGVTRARVSEIKNGKINQISLSTLVRFAERAVLPQESSSREPRGRISRIGAPDAAVRLSDLIRLGPDRPTECLVHQ